MKLSTLLQGVKTLNAFEDVEIERVTDKIKDTKENTLFVCIDGNQFDGHKMAKQALQNGAVAVICERDLKIDGQIKVENTRKAYSQIASNFYDNPTKKLKLIGVTGTNGKTSTSFFIKNMLNGLGYKCGLIGTIENDFGDGKTESILTTPEPMELQKLFRNMVNNDCEYCVMEVSSQALAQKRVYGLEYEISILTNITVDHLDYHITMENYINSKLELLKNSKKAIVNIDDNNVKTALSRIECPVVTCSTVDNKADYTAKNVICNESFVQYELVGINCIGRINVNLPGEFTVYNSLCASSALIELGFSIDDIANSTEKIKQVKGRAERVPVPRNFTVIIDYAHTPDGLENILKCIKGFTKGKIITVFGCGGDRDKSKRAEMGRIAGELSNIAVVTSDNPRTENPLLIINDILAGMEKTKSKLAIIENRRQAIEFALSKARRGDVVLLAGKGHETYQIIGNERIHFDEREIIKEYFKE
ncbi:MAG: UDP-N-acetylmuramoyl-L-alanyl-D-glutamate--2,6-diaminopimelate ligase [Clostridia bacterium]|nr:UDP-N-acetylmuramoyl-L-alanyl-D-glutamate--2,6-diaminopimelate ligase [Clostridia bacterium]